MSITPLSAARIAGELGLAGGTITGGACAASYSGQIGEHSKQVAIVKKDLTEQTRYAVKCFNDINEMVNDTGAMKKHARDCIEGIKQSMQSKVPTMVWYGRGDSIL